MTPDEEFELLQRVVKFHHAIMKDLYVLQMARSNTGKGAETRALGAAKRLDAIIKEYSK